MPAWKAEPLIAYPPMERWGALYLGWFGSGSVERIDGINMPDLTELYCDYNPLTALPWNDLRQLTYLSVVSCRLARLELSRLANLSQCYANDNGLLSAVDAHDNAALQSLYVSFCPALAAIDLRGCTNFTYLYAQGCALTSVAVDRLLGDLVDNGASYGYVELNGGTSAAPSDPLGVSRMNLLVDRGWTITTN